MTSVAVCCDVSAFQGPNGVIEELSSIELCRCVAALATDCKPTCMDRRDDRSSPGCMATEAFTDAFAVDAFRTQPVELGVEWWLLCMAGRAIECAVDAIEGKRCMSEEGRWCKGLFIMAFAAVF